MISSNALQTKPSSDIVQIEMKVGVRTIRFAVPAHNEIEVRMCCNDERHTYILKPTEKALSWGRKKVPGYFSDSVI